MEKVELLAPAGSKDSLMAGLMAGADAFYIGGSKFGARAYASNPTDEELIELINLVHIYDKKIYLTLNTLVKNSEIEEVIQFIKPFYENGIDALIIQDLGILELVQKVYPDLPIHASTQMSITSSYGASKLKELGATRIVPARELSLEEIKEIREKVDIELECFIHGAMCYAFSGQCLFSSLLGGRSGNRGRCAQPCRLPYGINAGEKNDYLSMKDLNTLDIIPELLEAGIISFKIEGRMKSPDYVYQVVSVYRKYIDLYYSNKPYQVLEKDRKRLMDAYQRRGYSSGYYKMKNGKELISLKQPKFQENKEQENTKLELVKLPLRGKAVFKAGETPKLKIYYKERTIMIEGDEKIETSKNRPATEKEIRKQLRKTGNTYFVFEYLEIEMEEGIFLPIKTLNELRRLAILKLTEAILLPFKRKNTTDIKISLKHQELPKKPFLISARVDTKEQLEVVLKNQIIGRIYADVALLEEDYDKKIYPALPYIFRKSQFAYYEKQYDNLISLAKGVLIRNIEELAWLLKKGYQGEIISDYNVYTMNNYAKNFLLEQGVDATTLPFELNKSELKHMENFGSEMIVYGRIPLMITANCPGLFCGGCQNNEEELYLEDRKRVHFPVKNYCHYCYNIIYNSTVLSLFGEKSFIDNLGLAGVSLLFTTENKEETNNVLLDFQEVFLEGKKEATFITEYTKGHFNRGVL